MKAPQTICAEEVVARYHEFKTILDARSPSEYALDHLPGAINTPVLDDDERASVGRTHAEQGAFESKRAGAALVSRNIADLIEQRFATCPRDWSPLVYCWRGGQRSGSLATVLARIGWSVLLLEGGYKAFRRAMLQDLARIASGLRLIVITGRTGSAKTQLLAALQARGAQVLDLEHLARHRGSVLGHWPGGIAQPSQKEFETHLWHALRSVDPQQALYVESESRKIGQCQIPEALILRMRASPVIRIEASREARTAFLLTDYAHLCRSDGPLPEQLERLTALHGHEQVQTWQALVQQAHWPALVSSLLAQHYDPAYDRSISRNFAQRTQGPVIELASLDPDGLHAGARAILEQTPTCAT
jgi:tRNA 2-selenouridine synthase